jgi:Tol biopolymer transport system component
MRPKASAPAVPPAILGLLAVLLGSPVGADVCHFEQLTDTSSGFAQLFTSDGAGRRLAWEGTSDPLGSNPGHTLEVFLFDAATGVMRQLTTDGGTGNRYPSLSRDGEWLTFVSPANLTGENPAGWSQVFLYDVRRGGLSQLTHAVDGDADFPAADGDGSRVVFQSFADLVGANGDHNGEIFYVDRNSMQIVQVTNTTSKTNLFPSISRAGNQIAFRSNADLTGGNGDGSYEVFLFSQPGGLVQVTSASGACISEVFSRKAFSADGQWLGFASSCNLLGGNADGSWEVFLHSAATGVRQLTSSAVDSFLGELSADGQTVSLQSSASFAGTNADGNREVFLRHSPGSFEPIAPTTAPDVSADPALDDAARRTVFRSTADLLGDNPDHTNEVFRRVCFPDPPAGSWMVVSSLPGFRFQVRIAGGAVTTHQETDCVGETLCVSGALPGRSELFVRIVGPKPNGYLWPNLVKFSTSRVEVWIEQLSSGKMQYYDLAAVTPESTDLTGFFDKRGFLP